MCTNICVSFEGKKSLEKIREKKLENKLLLLWNDRAYSRSEHPMVILEFLPKIHSDVFLILKFQMFCSVTVAMPSGIGGTFHYSIPYA